MSAKPTSSGSSKSKTASKRKAATEKKKAKASSQPLPADRFINRELSWLEFNERVLNQAADVSLPLLERAKFLAITSSNLDEFVMVRIGSLKMQYAQNTMLRDASGMTVSEQLEAVSSRCHDIVARQYELYRSSLEPMLRDASIEHIQLSENSEAYAEAAETRFHNDVLPVLSPQAIFNERPFPLLPGLSIHVCVRLKPDAKTAAIVGPNDSDVVDVIEDDFAVIPLGRVLPRVMPMPTGRGHAYVLLEELVCHHIESFFPGRTVEECVCFRITRNADVELREDGAADLMNGMEDVLESRRQSRPVRLEYTSGASDAMLAFLSEKLQLKSQDLYPIAGPLDLTYLFGVHGIEGFDGLRDEAWPAQRNPNIDPAETMFESISRGDILLVHPYEQFDPVVRLIEEASSDANVLAIKQVLYRTSRNSPIVAALMRAAERGKYVSVIVELKARFDEARNIEWAREMEQAGVQVIYGIRGLKTHAKVCIIVRRETRGIVRYMHFGTGNYNEATANLYGDVSLLTCNDEFGSDATTFFTCVTGASQPQNMQHLSAAPLTLRQRILDLIDGETRRSQQGQRAEIIAKLNALVDSTIIDALYRASQSGVIIKLNIRGVCCLKPGVKGLSETISVVSIIDRYLEHARIIQFRHGGDNQLFISSADWMPRNLDRRVELLVPVEDEACRAKLRDTLRTYFKDNTNTWVMTSTGGYERKTTTGEPFRAQKAIFDRIVKTNQSIRQNQQTRFETHQPKRD
ncbi:Polyphosphate kinase [Rubripirellula amarantea]|uniref:Polyphosphate kinase n=1 Tax=Rubripirellula amarantea TaxID=2527999 RepID=A0A5C5WRF2_9BACT|nr:polyphosphate kinase 1 [Rubripirellula amarantea]TWT53107.1 Polyphosphate kinase [Rubripirellula amarantea]